MTIHTPRQLPDSLRRAAARYPGKRAVICGGKQLTASVPLDPHREKGPA